MSWTLLIGLVLSLALASLVAWFRRAELRALEERLDELDAAREKGTRKARLSYPEVDLSRCLGCGACVRACPEEGVLAMIHGQALVVHGARCVGHGACARECPTGAIVVKIGDLESRNDIPALDPTLEAPDVPGLFLGGEVTGYALIRTAIAHGTAIADEVARRVSSGGRAEGAYDLCIVGAGPAGLAMALQARAHGLSFVVLEQESLGGTVAKYPRSKLVMTQPVDLPLGGRLSRSSYQKEELMELWEGLAAKHELPIHEGVRFTGLARASDGTFEVQHDHGKLHAAHVALALGRRGTPRKLGVPGEELPKVVYGLLDAQAHTGEHLLVVGGGDSAVEAALALAEQPGNTVTLSYRKNAFARIKARNEQRIEQAVAEGALRVLFESQVTRITPDAVELRVERPGGARVGSIPNQQVFVLIGGNPPFEMLQRCGVSFDPGDRAPSVAPAERGTGLLRALLLALALSLIALGWILLHSGYYTLPASLRPFSDEHPLLRPSSDLGLALGALAAGMMVANLAYLARRRGWFSFGTLKAWMTMHVLTGVLALLFGVLHGGMTTQDTLGHRALVAMAVVVVTGALGRYVYSCVPRAANGRELELDELKAEMAALSAEWDREHREFGQRVRAEVHALSSPRNVRRGFLARALAVVGWAPGLRGVLKHVRAEGLERGLPPAQVERLLVLARRAHRTATMAAHFEDLRALISSWRWMHRWVALFLVLVIVVHVVVAMRYGGVGP